MLQQTQVSVVIPYFTKWMETFPTVKDLAVAPLEQVLKLWEGLGYYSRARHLHAAAQYIVQQFDGEIPREAVALKRIQGIGPYTQGAILSFAFHKRAIALDGNVMRLLSRYFGIHLPIDTSATKKLIARRLEALLPDDEPWVVSEALIELGALVCAKQAKCPLCPLRFQCLAYQTQAVDKIPQKAHRQQVIHFTRQVAVIFSQGHVLLKRGERGKAMADLYEFPYLDKIEHTPADAFADALQLPLIYQHSLEIEKHSFTRYRVTLEPHLFHTPICERYPSELKNWNSDFSGCLGVAHTWWPYADLPSLPFSAGHRRILKQLNLLENAALA